MQELTSRQNLFAEEIKSAGRKPITKHLSELAEIFPTSQNSGIQFDEPDMNQLRAACKIHNLNFEIIQGPGEQLPTYRFSTIAKP